MTEFDVIFMCVIEALRIVVLGAFAYSFFPVSKKNTGRKVMFYFLAYVIPLFSFFLWKNIYFNFAATLISFFLISVPTESSYRKKLFFTFGVLAISLAIDFAVGFFFINSPQKIHVNRMASVLSLMLFLLAAMVLRQHKLLKSGETNSKYYHLLLVILLAGIGSLLILAHEKNLSGNIFLLVGGTFLVTDFMIIYLYEAILASSQNEKNQVYLLEQMKMYEKLISDNQKNEKTIKAIHHDMKNHLSEIQLLANSKNNSDIINYIEALTGELATVAPASACGVASLDGVLNYKIKEANDMGVTVNLKLTVPENLQISAFDTNVILGNLLDNAITAVKTQSQEKRVVDVAIQYKKECLFIQVSNPYETKPRTNENGKLISTKRDDNELHGIGLANVEQIVEKLDGMISIKYNDYKFMVDIMLPVKLIENIEKNVRGNA